ncbi:hypothetical protein AgCh_039879 [Apium graveolens]
MMVNMLYLQGHSLRRPQILLGNLSNGLYTMSNHGSDSSLSVVKSCCNAAISKSVEEAKLWHLRMGHLPFTQLKILMPSLSVKDCLDSTVCQICPAARQTRKPFPVSHVKSNKAFQLLHIDVWGPYRTKSLTGCNQFITIVDDFSRFTWVHLIKYKTEVYSVLQSFLNYVENHFHTTVQFIRSDNAMELSAGNCAQLYKDRGIIHQTTCAYTPQQNGVVERKHRHLLEISRAIFLQAHLPPKFWGDAILCASYIINRMPLQSLENSSPYFKLYNSEPSLDHMKTFGCLCYVSTCKIQRTKFDPRANAAVFLGYPNNTKGYKVFDLKNNVVVISRDVTFQEDIFPFHIISETSKSQFLNSIFLPKQYTTDAVDLHFPSDIDLNSSIIDMSDDHISDNHSFGADTSAHTDDTANNSDVSIPLRSSSRCKQVPTYLNNYYCNLSSTPSVSSHWCNLVSSTHFPYSHYTFMAQQSAITEPSCYVEASHNPLWISAMQKEIEALQKNKTWDLVPLPKGKKPIGSKWVYKVKLLADGSLDRCKARLVAKGFSQKFGIDFNETFSPVVKMSTVRCILSVAASRKWKIYQLDVNNAFLHGDLVEEVYMTVPEGIPNPQGLVCRLRKSLYGLRQASRQWAAKLTFELINQGFVQSKSDYSLFIYKNGEEITILAVYVDDIIITGSNVQHIQHIKEYLDTTFTIKDLGILHYFLGIEINYLDDGIVMSQHKFTKELLQECNMDVSKPAITPLPLNLKLSAADGDLVSNPEEYSLAPYLRYLSATAGQGIKLQNPDNLILQAFSDSDWASCPDSRRSVTGYILLLGGSPITWKSKKQPTVSRSSSEAEYRAMAGAASEVTWVVQLLKELGVDSLQPVTLFCDNQSALHIARNPVFHERTKHIEVDCHFTRDKVLEGLLQLSYLPTKNQLADVLTKILPSHQMIDLCSKSEADIIKNVVDGVSPKLNPMPLDVAKDLVGLDSHIEGIAYLLSSDQEDVIRIGIHGMGGVGKTTLSKAVFNQNYQRFQGSCFLENVREVIGIERGLECLQQQLINDVLKCQNIEIDNVDQGIEMIRARICPLKVLIVIDDLDDPVPLEYLEGPFAFGSIVMITTRNEDLLDLVKVETRYKVNELGDAESRQLFSQHAFADNKISDTFMELSQEILEHAGGLPLALKVFGSQLLNQFEGGQRCINKLKQASIDEVEAKLLISFDALKYLDPMLQDIFLDIACFFIGWKKEEVAKIMETCYAFVNRNIDILKKRCLLTINNRDELGMHDLLRDMGRRIACNNSPNEPGKHSRLWESKDIQDVLKEEKGTEAIEGIIPQKFYYQDELEGESFAARTFITMHKLRFLYLGKVALTGSFKHTFEDLRLLFWECCPLHCLPSEFHPQKLVILSLPCSKMKTMWELHMVSEVFENLKTLNMVHSLDLMTTPDFTKFPRLEILNLEGCKSLKEVHISIGSLGRLVFLNLFGCVNLRSLPGSICSLTALNVLKVGYCNSLEALPTNLGKIKSLKELNAESLTFSRFPDSIGHLSKLVELKLSHNENLRILPNTICNLKALRVLNISCCKSLEALPTELGCLESLEELDAKVLSVSELPDSIGRLSKLVTLRLSYNKNLRTLPDTICSLRALEVLDINGCKSLEALPIQLGNIESLKQFNAECLTVSKLPDSIGRLSKLVELRLSFNIKLKTLPDTMSNLRALEVLHIQNCYSLETLPIEFGYIESLKELNADGLIVRKLPDSIGKLGKLVELRLRYNSKLESLPDSIRNLRELEVLDIGYCRLEVLPSEFGNIESLKELNAEGLMVSKLPDSIGRLSKLVALRLSHSKNLETIQDAIFNLRSLELLTVDSCTKLGELPDQLWNITNLKKLDTTGATLLKNGPGISNHVALSLKKLDISKTVLAFLPSSMSQLLNLENLDLKDCHHLLSITKLPPSLKWIQASGCTSLIRLPNLSNLKQLEILELTDCSGLTVIQGLEELTSIKILGLRGCNSSVLAYIFTERFFQIYSEFGHQIKIYTGVGEYPDWISYSRFGLGEDDSKC